MKIVCGSCQAKYSIADEKVAGKVFKIRCKRCSEVIVVRGDLDQDAEAAPSNGHGNGSYDAGHSAPEDTSVDAIWHVVVNGEQAGPYTPSQLSEMLSSGQLDWEAYVWCEGFENWLPMRDVPELVSAISGQAEEPAAPVIAHAHAHAAVAAQPSMGADPFADEGGGAVGMFAQPAAQVAPSRSNLFAESAKAVAYDTNPKVIASAQSPRVSADQAMTGARNENSVLFSLKNLQALATG
ncbi:MAG TPA: GYF domain-containing protein, partial [Polyangiales bacterium]